MKSFALIGAAGYIAPRHMIAIRDTGHQLVAAYDPNDSVGIIDIYFPEANFFTEFERFDRHIHKRSLSKTPLDFLSVCTPSHLHDAHCRFGLRNGCDVICEKPLVLNPWNIDVLQQLEEETGNKIYNILQLRLHPEIINLKNKVDQGPKDRIYDIDLTYVTSRGKWYSISWKGDETKSGGIVTNIGIHFFDMLIWIFGNVTDAQVELCQYDRAKGFLALERANVNWFLSINHDDIPVELKKAGQRTFRNISVSGEEIEFSDGFTDLHTMSYQDILNGGGFGTAEVRKAIEIVSLIRRVK